MAKYIKHYMVDAVNPTNYVTTTDSPKYLRHPIELEGLNVQMWLTDSDGVQVMLSTVPNSTPISTVEVGSKKGLIELTEEQWTSVQSHYAAASVAYEEAMAAERSGDESTAAAKRTLGGEKMTAANAAVRELP